jgi:hypothetical protein
MTKGLQKIETGDLRDFGGGHTAKSSLRGFPNSRCVRKARLRLVQRSVAWSSVEDVWKEAVLRVLDAYFAGLQV